METFCVGWLSPHGWVGGGDSHIKKTEVLVVLLGVKKAVLVPLRVFSLKRSTAGALAVPLKVWSRKILLY